MAPWSITHATEGGCRIVAGLFGFKGHRLSTGCQILYHVDSVNVPLMVQVLSGDSVKSRSAEGTDPQF